METQQFVIHGWLLCDCDNQLNKLLGLTPQDYETHGTQQFVMHGWLLCDSDNQPNKLLWFTSQDCENAWNPALCFFMVGSYVPVITSQVLWPQDHEQGGREPSSLLFYCSVLCVTDNQPNNMIRSMHGTSAPTYGPISRWASGTQPSNLLVDFLLMALYYAEHYKTIWWVPHISFS